MRLPPPISFTPHGPDLEARLRELSATRGIYLLTISDAKPHLGWSVNLHRRLSRFLVTSYPDSGPLKSGFVERISKVSCWPTGSRLESSLMLYELAKEYFPQEYRKVLRLRMPGFVVLAMHDRFPRIEVMNRLGEEQDAAYGPFRTRDAAQAYQQQVEALFQVRRCSDTLTPHADHPGCIYGEMNQCMRPCQCAVSADEYSHEVQRVGELLATNGRSALSVLTAARDRASEEMEFEHANQVQKRIEKVESAAKARDEVIGAIGDLHGVALTYSARRLEFRLWPMYAGIWQQPVALDFSTERSTSTSLDSEIRSSLAQALQQPDTAGNKLEQLAVFARWYYSSWRDGSWFPFQTLADLKYRRLVREISKMAEESRAAISAGRPC